MKHRNGETETNKPRTERFYCISGQWYFSTRENLQIGPFPSREAAESELRLFLRHIQYDALFAERYYV